MLHDRGDIISLEIDVTKREWPEIQNLCETVSLKVILLN